MATAARRNSRWAREALLAAPRLGVGLGFRPEIARLIMEHCAQVDVLEVLADRILRGGQRDWEELKDLARIFPVIPHGVNLSIGSVDCLGDAPYMRTLKRVCRWIRFPYYSDHFALTKVRGRDIGHLTPLWRTREQLDVVVRNVLAVQESLGRPLVLETITVPFEIPGSELSWAEFFNEATRRTGCGLLLDLANVQINGANHGQDPADFLRGLDLSAVIQIHLAGGVREHELWVDSHSAPIPGDLWDLFGAWAPRCPNLKAVIIERDSHFLDGMRLLSEVRRARTLWGQAVSDRLQPPQRRAASPCMTQRSDGYKKILPSR